MGKDSLPRGRSSPLRRPLLCAGRRHKLIGHLATRNDRNASGLEVPGPARSRWLRLWPLALLLLSAACSSPPGGLDGGGGGDGGGDAGGGNGDGGGSSDGGVASCLVDTFLRSVGKDSLLVGAQMTDAVAGQAPFDVRYVYLSGALFDGAAPCSSCASSCQAEGQSCSNAAGGCGWWGCWQFDQDPPGAYARSHVTSSAGRSQLPMFTYYLILQASGVAEGAAEVAAANNLALMKRYFADFRFLLQQIGARPALVNVEPDFWGYAQAVNPNPHAIPAAVATANQADCSDQENSIAGFGRCLIAMTRKHAPATRIGLHASAWASGFDSFTNKDPALDVAAEGRKVGTFLLECGAGSADFLSIDASDRDAAWYESQGRVTWWDATNAQLPNFTQAFKWAKAVAEKVGRPTVWWQLPVGNMALPNSNQQWKDNRVDYFFAHPGEVVAAHGAAMIYGPGNDAQTNPSTDLGNLVAKTKAYAGSRQRPCP